MRVNIREVWERWRYVPALVEQIARDVGDIVAHQVAHARLYRQRPPRPHFVMLLVFAAGRGVGGATIQLVEGDGPKMIDFQWHGPQPLGEGLALVFCDLAAVQVDNFFRGTDLLGMNLASGAPLAAFSEVAAGANLRALVRLREQP